MKTAAWLLLTAIIAISAVFYAVPALDCAEGEQALPRGAVRLWNIDTFEGGRGSRTAFLNRVSAEYESMHKGTYVLVSSYTVEGAAAAFEAGNYPDLLSFGVGFTPVSGIKKAVLSEKGFSGGEVNGECLAAPWCRGVYAVYSLTDEFDDLTAKHTVLSLGGKNLVKAAAASMSLSGEVNVKESTAAYVSFLNGGAKYLLGTQRDACRFHSRGVNVYCRPIDGYSDLYQYISVLTDEPIRQEICRGYIQALVGEKTQKKLTELGMLSPYFDIYTSDSPLQDELERVHVKTTLGAFVSEAGLTALGEAAARALREGNMEVLKNFLKQV